MKTIRSALEAVYGRRLRGVLLYGLEARGEARPDSDIDVLVLLDRVADYGDILALFGSRCIPLPWMAHQPVDAQQYESSDCPLYRQVHREGIAT